MPRHDVAIYAPLAGRLYDPAIPHGGGAERQTWLLARSLARRGVGVAHIVHPVPDPALDPDASVTLVDHPRLSGRGRAVRELAAVWRSLSRADAQVQVLRGASGVLGVATTWARLRRRRVVFASANNTDFTLENLGRWDPRTALYRLGLRMADAVVVQSAEQVELARGRAPRIRRIEQIDSFAQMAVPTAAPGEAFLWVSRLAEPKQPLLYADLAAALPEARFWMIATRSHAAEQADLLAELERRAAALDNFELLSWRSHEELMKLVARAVAIVNTSRVEGIPNTFLEAWARGVPALTLEWDPDGRIEHHRLGVAAHGSFERFVAAAGELWSVREDRGGYGPVVRAHVEEVHGRRVEERWAAVLGDCS